MNTNLKISLLILLVINTKAMAQLSSPGAKPVKTGNEWRMPGDAIPRSQQFANELTKSLNLDETTAKKIFNAYLANTKSVDEIRIGGGDDKEKKTALQANQATFDGTLKGILSPAQFDKFIKIQASNRH